MKKIVTLSLKNLISRVNLLLLLLLGLFVVNASATETENKLFALETGIWEGISDSMGTEYLMLVLAKDGKHRLLRGNLSSVFRNTRQFMFTDENIICSESECVVSMDNPYEEGYQLRLLLTTNLPHIYNVLEISRDGDKTPILSRTYQLEKQENRPTVSRFVARYRARINSLASASHDGIEGFWLGVATFENRKNLIALDVSNSNKSEFVFFRNGSNIILETNFNISDVEQREEVYEISTSHKTFANKIIIHQLSDNLLWGNFYSYHKGQALENTAIQLHRIKQ